MAGGISAQRQDSGEEKEIADTEECRREIRVREGKAVRGGQREMIPGDKRMRQTLGKRGEKEGWGWAASQIYTDLW